MTTSRRYAKAILLLADEAKLADKVLVELRGVRKTLDASSELRTVLGSPVIKPEKKSELIKVIFPTASALINRLMDLLSERQKLGLLPDIAAAYEAQYNDANGIAEVILTSVHPLSDELTRSVKLAMERKTGKSITIRTNLDASLMGGITVQLGDTMYDGSVRYSLEKLEMLLHAPIA